MTTKSDQIRALGAEGVKPAEIAKRLGIRYQHAYNVLSANDSSKEQRNKESTEKIKKSTHENQKKILSILKLKEGGFTRVAHWVLREDSISIEGEVPTQSGAYAFVKNDIALYVGVATMGLAKRLYFYSKPGISQRTSLRLNNAIKSELKNMAEIEIYIATPPDLEWNGLPVHASAGLELGLIKNFELEWNMRGTGR